MRILGISVLLVGFALSSVSICSAKEWQGLVPLKSTRADVEKLLGPSPDSMYHYGPEIVWIAYSQFPCGHENPLGWPKAPPGWNVPRDTVVAIRISFGMKPISLASLSFDLSKFERVRGAADLPQDFYYTNKADGFQIEVFDTGGPNGETVTALIYVPTADEEALRCRE